MKAIKLDQPWASLIALGVTDIANLDFTTEYCGPMLIIAGDEPVADDFFEQVPVEYSATIGNHILMGNMPQLDSLPTGKAVAYADLIGESTEITDETSMWGTGPVMWQFDNIHTITTPTAAPAMADSFGDINGSDHDNLPATKPALRMPHLDGDELILPLSAQYFDEIMALDYKFVNFELADAEVADIILADAEKYSLIKFATVRLISNDGRTARFAAHKNSSVQAYLDDAGNPVMVPTIWAPQPIPWLVAHIALDRKI